MNISNRRAFVIPPETLRVGMNEVVLHSHQAAELEVIYLDLGIDAKETASELQDWTKV